MKKNYRSALKAIAVLAFAFAISTAVTGYEIGWGPFGFLFKGFEDEVKAIEKKYDHEIRKGEIVFYGASNFRLWKDMEEDLKPYKVQNHGFGGCTDKDLVKYADRILYPYDPSIVFFQTGSNDYVSLKGSDEEKIALCMEYKRSMFAAFHENLPEARFVVMSGLLLPGRSQYTYLTKQINSQLKMLCDEYEYMYFVDAENMTYDGEKYRDDLFRKDRIHLNHEGQLLWRDGYILPMIEKICEEENLQ